MENVSWRYDDADLVKQEATSQPVLELKRMINDKIQDEALWSTFLEYFKIVVANIPVNGIDDCVQVAAHVAPTLAYLKTNPQLLRQPGKLPKDIVDVALQVP